MNKNYGYLLVACLVVPVIQQSDAAPQAGHIAQAAPVAARAVRASQGCDWKIPFCFGAGVGALVVWYSVVKPQRALLALKAAQAHDAADRAAQAAQEAAQLRRRAVRVERRSLFDHVADAFGLGNDQHDSTRGEILF